MSGTSKRTWPWILGCLLAVAFTAIGFAGGWLVPRIPQKAYVYLDKIGVVDEIYMVKAGDTLRLQEQYRLRDWPFSMENGDTVVYYPRGLMDTLNRFQPRSRF